MKLKSFNIISKLIILCFIAITACNEDEPVYEATTMEIYQIKTDPNFYWYSMEYNYYELHTNTINALKDTVKSTDFSKITIVIFTAPSCLCGSDYIKFPQLMKVLDSAGITENNYQILVTKDESVNFLHPYSSIIQVKSIPDFYIIKDRKNIFSIMESLGATTNKTLETALLEGLCVAQQQ